MSSKDIEQENAVKALGCAGVAALFVAAAVGCAAAGIAFGAAWGVAGLAAVIVAAGALLLAAARLAARDGGEEGE